MEQDEEEDLPTSGLNDSIGLAKTTDFKGKDELATMLTATSINSRGGGNIGRYGIFTSLVE